MNSKFTRLSLFLLVAASFCAFLILLTMMFAGNKIEGMHVPVWSLALSMCLNFMLTIAIARFLWFQDEYFKMMSHFYPIVNRVLEVDILKSQGK